MATQAATVPATSPPGSVRLVVLKLTRQHKCDEDLEDGALDCDYSDQTQDRVRRVPDLEEPEELESDTEEGRVCQSLSRDSATDTTYTMPTTEST